MTPTATPIVATGATPPVTATQAGDANLLILVAFLVALAVVVAAATYFRVHCRGRDCPQPRPLEAFLLAPMGPPNWNLGANWPTTLTAAGTIFIEILAQPPRVDHPSHFPSGTFVSLGVMFGLLAVLASSVYTFIRRPVRILPDPQEPDQEDVQYQGYVLGFLASAVLTLWAALGQLAALFFLLEEIMFRPGATPSDNTGFVGTPSIRLVQAFLVVVALAMIAYGGISIYWTIKAQFIKAAVHHAWKEQFLAERLPAMFAARERQGEAEKKRQAEEKAEVEERIKGLGPNLPPVPFL